jgi:polyhydroxyalkanoate synthesis repressor PhaR
MNDTNTPKQTVTIKKYANRRLYNTATSSYVTLEDLSAMVKEGIEFNVYDAKTSEDITRSVLTQIIVEEEGKDGQLNLLPIGFLRNLIGYYGNNMQWMVPKYLEHSLDMFSNNQDQIKSYFQNTFGSIFPFGTTFEEVGKQNLAMFERAMRLFSPSGVMGDGDAASSENETPAGCCAPSSCCTTKPAETCNVTNISVRAENACCATGDGAKETIAKDNAKPAAPISSTPIQSTPIPSTPIASTPIPSTPMPNVKAAAAPAASEADDMQQKIASLQRQLADLAKNRA